MTDVSWHEFDTPEALAATLARRITSWLHDAAYTPATLILPGGSTPHTLYDALGEHAPDWSRTTLLLTDERWVAPTHPDSNESTLRARIPAAAESILSLCPQPNESLEHGAARLKARLQTLSSAPDVAVLGMGEDGHTASLFTAQAAQQTGLCLAIDNAPKAPAKRLSLSGNLLAAARHVVVLLHGRSKRTALHTALENPHSAIAAVLAQTHNTPMIYWSATA